MEKLILDIITLVVILIVVCIFIFWAWEGSKTHCILCGKEKDDILAKKKIIESYYKQYPELRNFMDKK